MRKLLIRIGHLLGTFWTFVILGCFYLTFFSVAALISKLLRHDPLQIRNRSSSTWQRWEHVGKKEDWYRPF